jgi:hypothetical protein
MVKSRVSGRRGSKGARTLSRKQRSDAAKRGWVTRRRKSRSSATRKRRSVTRRRSSTRGRRRSVTRNRRSISNRGNRKVVRKSKTRTRTRTGSGGSGRRPRRQTNSRRRSRRQSSSRPRRRSSTLSSYGKQRLARHRQLQRRNSSGYAVRNPTSGRRRYVPSRGSGSFQKRHFSRERKGPSLPANSYHWAIRSGNDGNQWESRPDKNNVFHWRRL